MKNVAALVLAGGRMGDYGVLTQNRAKGALTFGGSYRIIDFALSNLVNSGIHTIGLIIQYLPSSLIEHVGVGQSWGLDLHGRSLKIMPPFVGVEHTAWFKGTADAILQNINFIQTESIDHVLIVSGEHVYYMDYEPFLKNHMETNADVTIVTKEINHDQSKKRFGYITTNDDGKVTAYHEKPRNFVGNVACTGTYLFKTSTLISLLRENAAEEGQNLAKDILQKNVSSLNAREYRMTTDWEYMENVHEYYATQFKYAFGEGLEKIRKWNIQTNLDFRDTGYLAPTQYTVSANVASSAISNGCIIDGTVHNSILSPKVIVGKNAVVKNCILMHDCIIEDGAQLYGVISDRDACFGSGSIIGVNSDTLAVKEQLVLIGKGAQIGNGVVISGGAQVRPGKLLINQSDVDSEV